jgi:hypothetical protein
LGQAVGKHNKAQDSPERQHGAIHTHIFHGSSDFAVAQFAVAAKKIFAKRLGVFSDRAISQESFLANY